MTSRTIIKQTLELEELAIAPDTSDDKQESTPSDNLQISLTQQKLQRMKSNLHTITDTISKNKSLLSKAAESLNKIPNWGKIIIGLAFTLPILIIGLIFHMGILLLITGIIALGCVMTGLLLDEHHHSTNDMTKDIKACMSGIADLMAETIEVLAKTIDALNTLRQELSKEINRLQDENALLGQNIDTFREKINELTEANIKINNTAKQFQKALDIFIKNSFEANNNGEAILEKMEHFIHSGEAILEKIEPFIHGGEAILEKIEPFIQRGEQLINGANELQHDLSASGKQITSAAEIISLFTNQFLLSQAPLNPEKNKVMTFANNNFCFYNKETTSINLPETSQTASANEPISCSSNGMG